MGLTKDTRGIQMSFAWLFAIIAGMFILFLAIFVASKFIGLGELQSDSATAKRIDVLLNPLQTSFEEGKITKLTLPAETRIYNDCSLSGDFGRQYISTSQKSFNGWPSQGVKTGFESKYIFSNKIEQGKTFYVFSKNFESPFKISSVIFLISSEESYCFKNPPTKIKNEILGLKSGGSAENFYLESCPEESVKVCFGVKENCDVKITDTCNGECDNEYDRGVITRSRESIEYSTSTLMYGAIFSDKEVYDCQAKRLMKRAENLAKVYIDQSKFIATKECNTGMEDELLLYETAARNFNGDFRLFDSISKDMKEKNIGVCKLWD